MTTIKIKSRWDSSKALWSGEAGTIKDAVVAAAKGGADLGGAYLGDAYLGDADLRDADLRGADLRGADLRDAYLRGADLGGADLRGADLGDADLRGAYLRGADLGGAVMPAGFDRSAHKDPETLYVRRVPEGGPDRPRLSREERDKRRAERQAGRAAAYREAHPDVPVVEHIDAKILGALEAGGSLDMSTWHSCETTHCRAGWAIHLAGEKGYGLEKQLGSAEAAGRAIYLASTGRAPHFFASNERAMADIRRSADEDAAHGEGA